MWRVSGIQKKGNLLLEEIDSYLFAEEIEVINDKITLSLEIQKLFITENFTRFSDITTSIEDLKKLQDITVVLIDSVAKEEKEVAIEIEGGI